MTELAFSNYNKKYAEDFKRLNLEWIEKYFVVEEHDLEQLSNPMKILLIKVEKFYLQSVKMKWPAFVP